MIVRYGLYRFSMFLNPQGRWNIFTFVVNMFRFLFEYDKYTAIHGNAIFSNCSDDTDGYQNWYA